MTLDDAHRQLHRAGDHYARCGDLKMASAGFIIISMGCVLLSLLDAWWLAGCVGAWLMAWRAGRAAKAAHDDAIACEWRAREALRVVHAEARKVSLDGDGPWSGELP